MLKAKSGCGPGIPQPPGFKLSRIYRRAKSNTAAEPQSTHFRSRVCGHGREVVRNVVEPGGGVSYLCRGCWLQACAREATEGIRRRFYSLFKVCPRLVWVGGATWAIAARRAPIGGEGRAARCH